MRETRSKPSRRAGIGVDGGAEAARTVAEQHADGAGDGVGRGQVEMAVVVEVGRHHRLRIRADGEARGRAEAGREAVFQGFEVQPIRSTVRSVPPDDCSGLAPCRDGRADCRFRSQLWNDMVSSPFRGWSAIEWRDIVPGADRAPGRCRAGGGLLGGKDPTGRFSSIASRRKVKQNTGRLLVFWLHGCFCGLAKGFQLLPPLGRLVRLVPGVVELHQPLQGFGQALPG